MPRDIRIYAEDSEGKEHWYKPNELRALLGFPHRCPVCNGQRSVGAGFYTLGMSSTTVNVTCLTCAGLGVLWDTPREETTRKVCVAPDHHLFPSSTPCQWGDVVIQEATVPPA